MLLSLWRIVFPTTIGEKWRDFLFGEAVVNNISRCTIYYDIGFDFLFNHCNSSNNYSNTNFIPFYIENPLPIQCALSICLKYSPTFLSANTSDLWACVNETCLIMS